MKFRTFAFASLLLVALACGEDGTGENSEMSTTLTGIVVSVESEGLNEVTRFELKEGDEVHPILIDEDIKYGFPLGHLEEHRVSSAPVEVAIEERDGDLYALSIVDVEE